MKKLDYSLLLAILSFIVSCSSALVFETNDPQRKIQQATILLNEQNRPVGAINLLKQAIDLSQKQNNKHSEAIAEFYIAEIYKNPGKRGRSLLDINEAFSHYTKAIDLYNELTYYNWSLFLYWNMSNTYNLVSKKEDSRKTLIKAKSVFTKKSAVQEPALPSPYTKENLRRGIVDEIKFLKCSKK